MDQMADLQTKFSRALLDPAQPVPSAIYGATRRRADRRFAAYRNNVVAGLIGALAQRFPVVRRLVGDAFFEAMARAYVVNCLPASPIMLLYGESFPDFVENFAPVANVPYLSDVARLEMARGRAYHAADATCVEPRAFAALRAERLADLRFEFHPSVSIIKSPYPVVSIWRVNDDPDHAAPIAPWAPEAALIARPFGDVEVTQLAPGVAEFLLCLTQNGTTNDALRAGEEAAAEFDLVQAAQSLIMSRAVTRIRQPRKLLRRPSARQDVSVRQRSENNATLA
jgi:putative DNA-binding protein